MKGRIRGHLTLCYHPDLVSQRIDPLRIEPVRGSRIRRLGSRAGAPPLGSRLVPAGTPLRDLPGRPLAVVDYGIRAMGPTDAPIQVSVPLPQLGGRAHREVWCGNEPVALRREGRVTIASSGGVAFGTAAVPVGDGDELETATHEVYDEILLALSRGRHPHPLRFWNVLPRINAPDEDLERYRWFCRGRAEAFERRFGSGFESRLCAASAVGSEDGGLTVYFLAGSEPGNQVENPRQISAFHYPRAYGPRSPSFARATRCPEALGGGLLLSGTASIVGHRTLHAGDAVKQLEETLRNVAELTGEARPRQLKVFVRHERDLPAIRQRIDRQIDSQVEVLYLRADICRADLLLEIEGVAG